MKNKVNRVKEKIEWIQNLTVVRMIQGAMGINKDNQLSAFAAQAAFFLLLSFFPFAMMLLIGIRFLPVTQAEFIELVAEMIPGEMAETLSDDDRISSRSNLVGGKRNDGDRTRAQFYGSDEGYQELYITKTDKCIIYADILRDADRTGRCIRSWQYDHGRYSCKDKLGGLFREDLLLFQTVNCAGAGICSYFTDLLSSAG